MGQRPPEAERQRVTGGEVGPALRALARLLSGRKRRQPPASSPFGVELDLPVEEEITGHDVGEGLAVMHGSVTRPEPAAGDAELPNERGQTADSPA